MFDFIPVIKYFDVYINICLGIVTFTLLHTYMLSLHDQKNITFINGMGYVLLFFIIVYMGFRPISYLFGDMGNYDIQYKNYANGAPANTDKDIAFNLFMKFCSSVMSAKFFFASCALIYIYPMYRVSISFFKEYWYYSFLLLVISFSFWTYGVNGMRNGMATSIFLLGLSYHKKLPIMIAFMVLATLVHQTVMLPALAYTLTYFYNKPKTYIIAWFIAIPLSLALGGFWESLFGSLGFAEERLGGYLTENTSGESYGKTGFRWDFLIYSAGAVYAGWYFIFKRKYEDVLYHQLFNVYVICNAFWILVIRANFSNRFAYLSWFMMALVIIYPYLKQQFFKNQHVAIGRVVLGYFGFTYFMYLIYYS